MGKDNKKKARIRGIILVSCVAIASIVLGSLASYGFATSQEERLQDKYDLVAKRTLLDNPNDVLLKFSTLKKSIQSYVNTNLAPNQASIYFEYLPTGTSIGINEDEELTGASLLKTPLAINLYKAVDEGKINLDTKIKLKKEWLDSKYGELYKKGEGYELTLHQAVQIMLQDSDNTAALAVYDTLDKVAPVGNNLLQFIDIDYSLNNDTSIRISASTYSNILKCLYFSCYTGIDSSQEILTYLTYAKANNRLLLYLPEGTQAAHKIGTYDAAGQMPVQSDCGIVYIPSRSYLLCVMVKGNDPEASRIIGDISKITYDFITKD